MKTNCGIYKIIINDKIYIGSSINLKSRKYQHLSLLRNKKHSNNYLQNAFNKYGRDNFKWIVEENVNRIEDVEELKNILIEREQYYLDFYESYNPKKGYNIRTVADRNIGLQHSEDTKNKIKEKRKNQIITFTPEHREKIRKSLIGRESPMKGKKFTKQHRLKISESLTGKRLSEEHKKKISESNKGKKLSKETIIKMLESRKGYRHSLDVRNKISDSNRGKKHSERTKKKQSEVRRDKVKVINVTTGEIFNSIKEAANYYNIKSPIHISRVCRGLEKTCGGFIWKYV